VLTAEHPFWGCRRLWAYLRCVEQLSLNKQLILRLMRKYYLLVMPNRRLKAKRTPTGPTPSLCAGSRDGAYTVQLVLLEAITKVAACEVWLENLLVAHVLSEMTRRL
jgi:hypothetical protein